MTSKMPNEINLLSLKISKPNILLSFQTPMLTITTIFFLFIFPSAESRTDLSKANCPSRFYISQSNVTSITGVEARASAASFYALYDTPTLTETVDKIVIQGDQEYLEAYISSNMWIFVILIAFVFALLMTFCFCWVFDRSCPPKNLRRDINKNPYTMNEYRCITVLLVIFSVTIVIVCLVAFSYIPSLKAGVSNTQCSIYVTLDAVLNGQDDTSWGGFINMYEKIGNVSLYLTESIPAMDTYLTGDEWLDEKMLTMRERNTNIYSNNKDATLLTPNPTTTKTAVDNNLDIPQITSRFIDNGLGPNGTFGTLVDDIDRGLRLTQTLSQEAYNIEIAAKRLKDSEITVLENSASSQLTLQMYISQLESLTTNIDALKVKYFEQYFVYGINVMQGALGLEMMAAVLCLFGIVSVYSFQIFTCRMMVTFGWIGYGCCYAGIIFMVYVTLAMGSLGHGFCTYFDSMLNEEVSFNKIIFSYSQNPFNRLDKCFHGDGNVLEKFNLEEEMSTVTNLFEHIQTYYDYEDTLSTNYIDKAISTGKISNWLTTLNNYKLGVYIDYDETETTDTNPNYAIQSLNLYTLGGGGVPTCSKDKWVFDSINCTNVNEETYASSTASNGVALETTDDAICVSFNERFSTLQSNSWTQNDFTKRYTQIRASCPDAYEKILEYGYSIISYRNNRQKAFQGMYDELLELQNENIIFNNNITSFKSKVQTFQTQVSDLNNIVTNSIDGLLVSSDCRAIVDDVRFVYNMFCINLMSDIVKIGWCCVILGVVCLLALITAYIWASWFKVIEESNKNKDIFLRNEISGYDDSQQGKNNSEKGFQVLAAQFNEISSEEMPSNFSKEEFTNKQFRKEGGKEKILTKRRYKKQNNRSKQSDDSDGQS